MDSVALIFLQKPADSISVAFTGVYNYYGQQVSNILVKLDAFLLLNSHNNYLNFYKLIVDDYWNLCYYYNIKKCRIMLFKEEV